MPDRTRGKEEADRLAVKSTTQRGTWRELRVRQRVRPSQSICRRNDTHQENHEQLVENAAEPLCCGGVLWWMRRQSISAATVSSSRREKLSSWRKVWRGQANVSPAVTSCLHLRTMETRLTLLGFGEVFSAFLFKQWKGDENKKLICFPSCFLV